MEEMIMDQLLMMEALYEIMMNSDEADMVRRAAMALTSTTAGKNYLTLHPIRL